MHVSRYLQCKGKACPGTAAPALTSMPPCPAVSQHSTAVRFLLGAQQGEPHSEVTACSGAQCQISGMKRVRSTFEHTPLPEQQRAFLNPCFPAQFHLRLFPHLHPCLDAQADVQTDTQTAPAEEPGHSAMLQKAQQSSCFIT